MTGAGAPYHGFYVDSFTGPAVERLRPLGNIGTKPAEPSDIAVQLLADFVLKGVRQRGCFRDGVLENLAHAFLYHEPDRLGRATQRQDRTFFAQAEAGVLYAGRCAGES